MKPEERYKHYYNEGYNAGSVKGYEQAVDDAVSWLEKKACLYVWANCEQGEHGIHKIMLEDFRKAMKGE